MNEQLQKNCLSYWYPKIERVVPTPKTLWVKVSDGWDLLNAIEGGDCWYAKHLLALLADAAQQVGFPCFLRTGQGSGKHDWNRCCYVTDAKAIPRHVSALVEWSYLVDMMGLPHDTWVVRAFLPTAPKFHCTAYGGMPVVKEWRYFIDDGKVLYGIPYWPEDALEQGKPDSDDWRLALPYLHSPLKGGETLAASVANVMQGRWSVDALEGADGISYVTDMAIAERSWGWDAERIQ